MRAASSLRLAALAGAIAALGGCVVAVPVGPVGPPPNLGLVAQDACVATLRNRGLPVYRVDSVYPVGDARFDVLARVQFGPTTVQQRCQYDARSGRVWLAGLPG